MSVRVEIMFGARGWKDSWKNCVRRMKKMDTPSEIILKLVNIAEYSSPDWRNSVNIIADLDDGRGYTIGLCGFCTGTGDFLEVLKYVKDLEPTHVLVPFIPVVEGILASDHKDSTVGLKRLPKVLKKLGMNDQAFLKATWAVLKRLYWKPALEFCDRFKLESHLSRYIVYDTIMNFGDLRVFDGMQGEFELGGEEKFLLEFLRIKQRTIENDETLGDTDQNRVDMQLMLLKRKNFNLTRPMTVYCYGDRFYLQD